MEDIIVISIDGYIFLGHSYLWTNFIVLSYSYSTDFSLPSGELETLDERFRVTNENLKTLDKKLGELQKKRKKSQTELESYRLREREIADKIEEDAKELEKMASKQTVLQVGHSP